MLGRLEGCLPYIPIFPVGEGRREWGRGNAPSTAERSGGGIRSAALASRDQGVQLDVPGFHTPEHWTCLVGSLTGTGILGFTFRATPYLPPLCPTPSVLVNV